jgi:isoleucyl-tRNA synthetase
MIGNFNFKEVEKEILEFWEKNQIYKTAKKKNKGKEKFTYLDGPPYTSGKIHLGHAWGKAIRDSVMRFKRMNGFDVWDRAGFDMHGLPTENKVCAELNLERKEDIEEFGLEKFQKACEEFCIDKMKIMIKDFKSLGIWMDFENPYMPIKSEYMEGEWFLAKRAFEENRLYEGSKVMTWCRKCSTSLSKHELEYENVNDNSIYVKFKLTEEDDTYFIIWTTTPWTIPFNLGIMVNPDLDYIKVDVDGEKWIIAKDLESEIFSKVVDKSYIVLEEMKGKALEGKRYKHIFFNETPRYKELEDGYKNAFTVLLSKEYVDTSVGTGLVHCAPGCGPADHEVGLNYGLPAFNETDQYGTLKESMKKLSGLTAKKDDKLFIEHIKNTDSLVALTSIKHEYPHCWRCKQPIIFRTTKQWFFKTEDLKERMIELNKEIKWEPKAAFNAFESWLENIKDNGITRQRYWGTPVPIWKCSNSDCDNIDVFGSVAELKEKADNIPENLHKPWIDKVTYKCEKCSSEMRRIPDIFDVWIDAGSAGWLCFDYPRRTDLFEKWFPADFITEGKDQIRGWFNLLMVASTIAFNKAPFKSVYMTGFINDYRGMKMSKSLGNVTDPFEVVDSFGTDVLRYYTIGATKAGLDMNYNPEDTRVRFRNVLILWNMHKFLSENIKLTNLNLKDINLKDLELNIEDKYILSRLHSTIKNVTNLFDDLKIEDLPNEIENMYLDLSRVYIQQVRETLAVGDIEDKKKVLKIITHCLEEILKLLAPIAPFITEKMYLNLKDNFEATQDSIHLTSWPKPDSNLINKKLEESYGIAEKIIQSGLRAREKSQIGLRWPVKDIHIESKSPVISEIKENLSDIIKSQLNTQNLFFIDKFDKVEKKVKVNYKNLGSEFGKLTPKIIQELTQIDNNLIASDLESKGKFILSVDGEDITIKEKHVDFEHIVPDNFEFADFKDGVLYLNKDSDEELLAKGYAREIMRRVQSLRKNAGLNKSDLIDIKFYSKDTDLIEIIKDNKEELSLKIGSRSVSFSDDELSSDYLINETETIKDKTIQICFNKI